MEFLSPDTSKRIDLPAPVLVYPQLQSPSAPGKKSYLRTNIGGLQNGYTKVKMVTSIIVTVLLVMIVALGGVAIAVFADKDSSCQIAEVEDPLERIELGRKDWAVLSGSIVARQLCNRRPHCQEGRDPKSAEFASASPLYGNWLDRHLRVSNFNSVYVGTIITTIKCDRLNATVVDFDSIWEGGSQVPSPQLVGRELALRVLTENRDRRRHINFDVNAITIEGVYESRDDEVVKKASHLVPAALDCGRNSN